MGVKAEKVEMKECTDWFFGRVLGLRYECDRRVLLWVAIYHVLTFATWRLWDTLSFGWSLALVVQCALWSFFGATITHNTIHVPVFKTGHMNSLFQIVLTHTYGWPVSALVPGHNLSHHKFTNTAKDAMRPDRMRYSWNLLNYVLFPVATASAIAASDKQYIMDQRARGRPIWKQYLLEAASFYSVQAMLAVHDPRRWVFIIFLPQLYAKFQIIAMNILQHDGCPAAEADPWNNARNFTGSVINYMTFNNGYHTIHHTNPGWHWRLLADAHDLIIKPHIHPNLDQDDLLLYFFRAHIYPGKRLWYDGSEYVLPPDVPDVKWYYGTAETYSSSEPVPDSLLHVTKKQR